MKISALDITLFVTGGILLIALILIIWRVIVYLKVRRIWNEKLEPYKKETVTLPIDFQVPLSYQKLQGVNPWRQNIPMVSVTQHIDDGSENGSPQGLRKSPVDERQKKISAHMLSDLIRNKKHISDSHGSSSDDYLSDHLSAASMSDDCSVSSFVGSDESGREYNSGTNVYGVKKRMSRTRRLGSGTHHTPFRPSFKKTGKISFETQYDQDTNKLYVHIIKAYELGSKLDTEQMNPFIRMYLVPGKHQKQSTRFKKGTKEPVFNETLTFVGLPVEKMHRNKLRIKVYNHSRLRKHELIGEVDIALVSLDLTTKELFNVDLFLKKSETSQATCLVSIAHQAIDGKLLVQVKEAKNLPKTKIGNNPDSYLVVRLYKGDMFEKKESEPVRNTRSPHFEDSFQFHLSTDFEFPLSIFSLVVSIVNYNLIGRDEIIGHVIFSLDSPQPSAMSHWKDVINKPQDLHMRWHSLVAPEDL